MNRFRTKKKAKDDLMAPRPSTDSDQSAPFRLFGRKKVQEEEPEPAIDLATALPSSDDFRTSLLMNGLSARFSMLREQDDPNSKIGKASDDSVLFPKRQSRMDMFGTGLHDIAEVESIRSPPFARMDSYHSSDDAASMSGSVMSRAKPTEGNNLFGGRQKVYKIAPGGSSKNIGLSGRVLYDDDVAQSAFQKWRQAEKDRQSLEEDAPAEQETLRPESPQPNDFSRRRETNSTTSSGPSLARNSTAATSITSTNPAASLKDWQSSSSVTASGSTTQIPERSVTRTRRLYEQSLTQEIHESQNSALSRLDTITRRPFGVRSPETGSKASSPTSSHFGERRPMMLTKASAPNLRSFTPPTTTSPAESSSRFPVSATKSNFGTTPPLSPPVSETEETHPVLSILPNDVGKATAMGLFNRPSQPYDEAKYAQLARQLHQGRETPTSRFRAESSATARSASTSSAQRVPLEKADASTVKVEPPVLEELPRTTFLDDSESEHTTSPDLRKPREELATPRLALQRPNDQDHPALRQSALPTPLSIASPGRSGEPSPILEDLEESQPTSKTISPEDSPTLGPQTGNGLSGIVRQHLRGDSNASSAYGLNGDDDDNRSRYSQYRNSLSLRGLDVLDSPNMPWDFQDDEHSNPYSAETNGAASQQAPSSSTSTVDVQSSTTQIDPTGGDDFARHLADGARRVRERLTTYVDSENGQALGLYLAEPAKDLQPPNRPSTRESLRSKTSFGSMRKDKRDNSQSRAKTLLGLGSSTITSAPSPTRLSNNGEDSPTEGRFIDEAKSSAENAPSPQQQNVATEDKEDKDDHVHAGLKAFRQARRELQKMKEHEVQQRRNAASQAPQQAQQTQAPPPMTRDRAPSHRAPSQERRPPVSYGSRQPSEDSRMGPGSRAASRAASRTSERDRSGSETSNGRAHSRPPYLRNIPTPSDDQHHGMHSNLAPGSAPPPRHSPMARSPAYGPQDGPGMPYRQDRSPGLPASPRPGAMPPAGPFPQRPSAPTMASDSTLETMGRPRNGSQLGSVASTPNLHGSAAAPPLPPINPRRKNAGGALRRPNESDDMTGNLGARSYSPARVNGGRMPVGHGYDDAGYPGYHDHGSRQTSTEYGNGGRRGQHPSPPRNGRAPLPAHDMPAPNIPGGMF